MKKSALVIGGGIAGLAAARELLQNKIPVTLLEAKNRFGGRIHTIRDGNLPIELGAEFLHGQTQSVIEILREAKLPTQTVAEENKIVSGGKQEDAGIWEIASDVFLRINPQDRDCSFDEFVANQNLPARVKMLARNFVEGFNAADAGKISAHALRRADFSAAHMAEPEQMRITAGYSALVEFFVQAVSRQNAQLITGATAREIRWREKRVDVLVERGNRLENFEAGAAVIAVPLGVLKSRAISFEPPPGKQEAIRELLVGNAAKIIFHFREQFWNGDGFFHAPDEKIPTWWSDPRGPVLTGWAGGPKADALLKSPPEQLQSLGLKILGKIFSSRDEDLRRQLQSFHFWNWADDPQSRGAYSYIPAGGLDLPGALAAPVAGTLFFAGEATVSDAQTGTVVGAIETGIRAARELLSA